MLSSALPFQRLTENESAQLDSARGASAILVAVAHTNQAIIAPTHPAASLALGLLAQASVMVFFVLSGFLIGKSISGNLHRNSGRFAMGQYLYDRVLRIWPPLLLSLLLVVALHHLAPLVFPSGTADYLPSSSYTPSRSGLYYTGPEIFGAALAMNGYITETPRSNGPLWSLSIEVWYYALAAILAFPRGHWRLLALPFALGLMQLGGENIQFFYYMPVWFAGYALSVLHDRQWLPRGIACIAALVIFCGIASWSGYQTATLDGRAAWLALVRFNVFVGFAFCILLAMLLSGKIAISTRARPAAAYAYTLYVIHFPLLLFIFGVFQKWIERGLAASLTVSIVSLIGIVALARWIATVTERKDRIKALLRLGAESRHAGPRPS